MKNVTFHEYADTVPAWAEDYLRETLGDVQIVNVHVLRHGAFRGSLLINTSEGCALLHKQRFGEPTLVRLPLPGQRFAFDCTRCTERIELHEPETPRDLYCTRCAKRYLLTREAGTYVLLTDLREGNGARPEWRPVGHVPPRAEPAPAPPTPPPTPQPEGPFMFEGYTLYTRKVTLKGGRSQRIYFFSKKAQPRATATTKPADRKVVVTAHGLPVLRKVRKGEDPDSVERRSEPKHYRPQCQALRADGKQCRNSARASSKYCASHRSYRPPTKTEAKRPGADTKPRVRGARDTRPSFRKPVPA